MDKYEYKWVDPYDLKDAGENGFRVVPGIMRQENKMGGPWLLVELVIPPKEEVTEDHVPEPLDESVEPHPYTLIRKEKE